MFDSGQTATVKRPSPGDQFGDRASFTTHEVEGCSFAQNSTSTESDQRRTTTTTATILCDDPGADIRAGDEIQLAGGKYLVEGKPWVVQSPFSDWRPGVMVTVKEVA